MLEVELKGGQEGTQHIYIQNRRKENMGSLSLPDIYNSKILLELIVIRTNGYYHVQY